jgi:hypothetical protein
MKKQAQQSKVKKRRCETSQEPVKHDFSVAPKSKNFGKEG